MISRLYVKQGQLLRCGTSVGLVVMLLAGCIKARIQPLSPTKQISQLLTEPERWQSYTPEQRFAMYNNVLQFYENKEDNNRSIHKKSENYISSREIQRLDDIFLSFININPRDPYNSYYLYNVAGHYIERGEEVMGLWLLRSMYQQFPDLKLLQYPSIHYLILDTLGRMETNIDDRIDVIQRILAYYDQQFSVVSDNNMAHNSRRDVWLYRLGKAYETKATEMLYINREVVDQQLKAAINVYSQFVRGDSISVPEEHNARNIAVRKINIYNTRRSWYTDASLGKLIRRIKYAIQNKNIGAVLYYQANGFFVLSADYRDEVLRRSINIYLPHFLGGVVQFGDLIPESNDKEAWLYSTNWPFHLSTWYLYFHKIDYPTSPDIDGNWEWSGIYLGDFY